MCNRLHICLPPIRCFGFFAPLLRQLAKCGGGEDGLTEAFENDGEAVEAVAAGIHSRQHGVEFVGDAFLFGERRNGQLHITKLTPCNSLTCCTRRIGFHERSQLRRVDSIHQPLVRYTFFSGSEYRHVHDRNAWLRHFRQKTRSS